MTQTLLPATGVLQGADVARPGAKPAAPGVRGDDAFAARLARAQVDAQPQTEPGASADAAAATQGAAPPADPTIAEPGERDERGKSAGLAAEVLAVIAFAPSTPSAPLTGPVMPAPGSSATAAAEGAAAAAEGAALSTAAGTALCASAKAAAGATTPLPPTASSPTAATPLPTASSSASSGISLDPAGPSAEPTRVQARAGGAARDDTPTAPPGAVPGADTTLIGAAAALPTHAHTPTSNPGSAFAATAHAAAPSLHIAAAVDTPAFAPALAQQVSWLVREGVGLASLQLNPPELGPVTVQIVVEGRQARVDFGAELGLTRSAIEDSLPRLASALQDIGLTLSGGGVFDGRPRRDAPAPKAERSRAADDAAPTAGPPAGRVAVLQAPRGLVDLVA